MFNIFKKRKKDESGVVGSIDPAELASNYPFLAKALSTDPEINETMTQCWTLSHGCSGGIIYGCDIEYNGTRLNGVQLLFKTGSDDWPKNEINYEKGWMFCQKEGDDRREESQIHPGDFNIYNASYTGSITEYGQSCYDHKEPNEFMKYWNATTEDK